MSNEKYYDYFKTDAETRKQFEKEFNETVTKQRDTILENLKTETGCIAWRERSGFGHADFICELVFPVDHETVNQPYIKVENTQMYEGQKVSSVRGMGNRKLGKEFNAMIHYYNEQLKDFPKYTDWVINKLGVMRTGMGGVGHKGHGVSMLSSYGGNAADVIVIAIPNDKSERHGSVEVPSCLKPISYGVFYDLTHKESEL